jgi:hypothetical protein
VGRFSYTQKTVSHVFSTPPQGSGSQRLSADEAKQLIRTHQNRETEVPGSVTVQDMAEALGLPTWQVEQMVQEMRSRPRQGGQPMPAKEWLIKKLWIWALASIAVLAIGTGGFGAVGNLDKSFNFNGLFDSKPKPNRTQSDGIYEHAPVVKGRELGMAAPPGFSYIIKYGTLEAAANGDSKNYIHAEDLDSERTAIAQEAYTRFIIDGLDKAVAKVPPQWVDDAAIAVVTPNYYPAGYADSIDITLKKAAFPYDPASPAGKEFHDQLLKDIQDHWKDITG